MCAGLGGEQSQSRHLIKNVSGKEQQSYKQSFKKKALKPHNGKTMGNHPYLYMTAFCTLKTLYAKLHILLIRSFIIMYYWGVCFAVGCIQTKNLTPDFLRVEKMHKLDGDITQNFFCLFASRVVQFL